MWSGLFLEGVLVLVLINLFQSCWDFGNGLYTCCVNTPFKIIPPLLCWMENITLQENRNARVNCQKRK